MTAAMNTDFVLLCNEIIVLHALMHLINSVLVGLEKLTSPFHSLGLGFWFGLIQLYEVAALILHQ